MGIFDSSSHVCPPPKNADQITTIGVPITGSLTFQHLMLYICSGCLGLVGLTCLLNIFTHLRHYSAPNQQRQIIRIVFTPVVFCLFSVCSVANYSTSIYMDPIRDLYEVFAMASIFLLFVEWVAPDPSTLLAYFSTLENRKPQGGRFSKGKSYTLIPGGSLNWFKTKWSIMFLSLVIDIIITIVQEASQAAGTYCVTSMKPYFAHLWVLIIGHASIIVGVLAVLNLYMRLKPIPEFSSHNPLLKLASLKLIVLTNFIQTLVFSILQGQGVLTGNNKITANDLQYGIPALLVAVEQLVFSGLMLYSFRAAEYKHQGKAMSFPAAIFHALNPLDLIQSIIKGFTYLFTRKSPSQTFPNGSTLRKTYSSGEETTLQPYQYPNTDTTHQPQTQAQYAAPTQPPPSHSAHQQQEQYVGVIPKYGGQPGDYPVSDAAGGYQGGRRGGRRHHGPIGMLISAGMGAYQSSQGKR
jgi:hypothetical protein